MKTYPSLPKIPYSVYRTKSGKSWLAWPSGKKKQGKIFATWHEAIKWATMQAFVLQVMAENN